MFKVVQRFILEQGDLVHKQFFYVDLNVETFI